MLVRSLVGQSGTLFNYKAGQIVDLDDTVAAARIAAGLAVALEHGSVTVTDGSTTVSNAISLTFAGTVTDLGNGEAEIVGTGAAGDKGDKGDTGDTGADGSFSASAPASAGATGVAGSVAYDSGFVYVCVATDTWKRVAIATWP